MSKKGHRNCKMQAKVVEGRRKRKRKREEKRKEKLTNKRPFFKGQLIWNPLAL